MINPENNFTTSECLSKDIMVDVFLVQFQIITVPLCALLVNIRCYHVY